MITTALSPEGMIVVNKLVGLEHAARKLLAEADMMRPELESDAERALRLALVDLDLAREAHGAR